VEAMIEASIDHAEEDILAAQVAQARVEADAILAATDKAKRKPQFLDLSAEERDQINRAIVDLQAVYHSNDHHVITEKIEALNETTRQLAENIMNTAVQSALQGTKI